MSEEITRFVTDLIAAWNSHDIERIAQFYAEDFEGVDVAYAAPRRGRDDIRHTMSRYLTAFPDLQFSIKELVVQGNKASLAWVGRGTHEGKVMNIPPSGRQIEIWGTSFFTVKNQQISYSLHIWDVAGLLRSIGLLPELHKV